jgi:hypothetical protein
MGLGGQDFDRMGPGGYPRPVVRFGAIGEAWDLVLAQWRAWALAVIVVIVANWIVGGVVFSIFGVRPLDGLVGFRAGIPRGPAATQVVLGAIVNGFFVGGMFRMACRQVRGMPVRTEDLVSVVDVLGELVLGSVLYAAAVFVASLFCVLPGFLVHGLLMFTLPLIVDGRVKATDAMARSFHTLKGEWLGATAFHLVVSFLSGLGTCFCCVGLLFTAPLYVLSIAILYRDAFLAKGMGVEWKPPPPDGDF